MKPMIFVSDSMLVFQVMVDGVNKVVEFSERSQEGLATFCTEKEDVIEAIRKHKFYRIGKIREYQSPRKALPAGKTSGTVADPAGESAETVAGAGTVGDGHVMEFSGFSQLKSYLRKTYKDDEATKTLKTPKQVSEYAAKRGVNYRFTES